MLNKTMLIGILGRDPELRFMQDGVAKCTFSIATVEQWTDKKGDKHSETEWHNIVVWGKLAESCGKNLTKGAQVYVEGPTKTKKWEDKDKNPRQTKEVQAEVVNFLKRGPDAKSPSKNKEDPLKFEEPKFPTDGFAVDDIPF